MQIKEFMKSEWELERNLFSSGPPDRAFLKNVFTGREREIQSAISSILDAPRRLLINGSFGIGKTVLIKEMRRRIEEEYADSALFAEDCLYKSEQNIAQPILRAISNAMKGEDSYAANVYNYLIGGKSIDKLKTQKSYGVSGGAPKFIQAEAKHADEIEKTISFEQIGDPVLAIKKLIKDARARKEQRRIIIAIDDLDKKDPDTVREILTASRELLHDPHCSFILTGHPLSILRDVYSTAGGIIDLDINLKPFDHETSKQMIARYLGAGRVKKYLSFTAPSFKGDKVTDDDIVPFANESADIIINQSFGIPRVLNIICFHILQEAANNEYKRIKDTELVNCWNNISDYLKSHIRNDLNDIYNVISEESKDIEFSDIRAIPDSFFNRLNVDSTYELLQKLDYAIKHDLLIMKDEQRQRIGLNPIVERLNLLPPDSDDSK